MKSDILDVEVIFQTVTDRAVCVRVDEDSEEDIWIPLAVCEIDGRRVRGGVVTVSAPERVMIEQGLA